jgi:hypothetical protein
MPIKTFSPTEIQLLDAALNTDITGSVTSAPVVNTSNQNAQSPNADENTTKKGAATNTPIAASGNALKTASAIKKSNNNLSKACDSSSYVGKAVAQIGLFAGQTLRAFREGVKAALAALGLSPSGNALSSKIKKVARWISDVTKFIKKITGYVTKFLAYVKLIQQAIAFIATLPARLLKYFQKCLTELKKQLVASFTEGLGLADGNSDFKDTLNALKDVQKNVTTLTKSITTLATTTATAAAAVNVTASAAKAVFDGAGFSVQKNKFGKA